MTENHRIKEIRTKKEMTMEQFAQCIGVARGTISRLESGKINVTNQMRRAICREFGVSENWLRTGDGDMFEQTVSHVLDEAVSRYHLTQKDRVLIEKFIELPPNVRSGVLEYIERAADALRQLDEQEQIDRESKEVAWQFREEKEQADGLYVSQDTDSEDKMA